VTVRILTNPHIQGVERNILAILLVHQTMTGIKTVAILVAFMMNSVNIFDFDNDSDVSGWRVEDDVVMGGRSSGHFELTEEGHGHFYGEVSLENNGGFSSVEKRMDPIRISPDQHVVMRVKGDGKRYQFRFKERWSEYYSYIQYFETSGEWEEIRLPLDKFVPWYRGNKVNRPDFNGDQLVNARFLIANKQPQQFSLLIDFIRIEDSK